MTPRRHPRTRPQPRGSAYEALDDWLDVVVRPDDRAVVLASTDELDYGAFELIEFDPGGMELWRTSGILDYGHATQSPLALLSDGGIVVSGLKVLTRFDASGQPLWTQLPGLEHDDYRGAIAITGDADRIYVTGQEQFFDGPVNVRVFEYLQDGQLGWTTLLEAGDSGTFFPHALLETLDERLVVGGLGYPTAEWRILAP